MNDTVDPLEDDKVASEDGKTSLLPSSSSSSSSRGRRCDNFFLRFGLAFVACVLGAGTLGSWSQFVSLLVDAGVFDAGCHGQPLGKCQAQNNRLQLMVMLGSVAQNILSVPVGLWYDRKGPLVVGVAGFVIALVGLLGIGVALLWKSMEGFMWVAVPVANLGQTISSWGIFGFIFFYPKKIGLLVGLANSSFLVSGLMMYLVAVVTGASKLIYGILLLGALTGLSIILTWISVPGLAEYVCTPSPPRTKLTFFFLLWKVQRELLWRVSRESGTWIATPIHFCDAQGNVIRDCVVSLPPLTNSKRNCGTFSWRIQGSLLVIWLAVRAFSLPVNII